MSIRLLFFIMWAFISLGMYMGIVTLPQDAQLGDSFRILFFHLPAAILAFSSFTLTAVTGIMYLRTNEIRWDMISAGAVRLGFIFGALALATGWAFSYLAWGTKWSWDPKVVATLVMWFVYSGYLMLRRSVDEESRRARLCAVYGIVGYVSVPLSYLSSRLVYSLHPEGIGLTLLMKTTAVVMTIGFFLLYFYLLWFDMKLGMLSRHREAKL
ncbi:MAG TPA: cytochrome c biogenesis protein CcsA [Candidatus Methylomirabilis sp.]|nr:cytochrome c biogenesis protein CcsA [Candidatus Methylomirabilis sp.]